MPHILFRDFETRSTLALRDVGAWRYSLHPDTEIWCCAFAVNDDPVQLWLPGDPVPPEFLDAASNPDWLCSAFNDNFERQIEQHIMGPRYGWPQIPIERHRCSQAAALALALPATLEKVALALGLEQQKDLAGRGNMLRMSRPRRPRKGEDPTKTYWVDDLDHRERLYAYCRLDVETERSIHRVIGFLDPAEQAIWILDAAINDRGIQIDGQLAASAIQLAEETQENIRAELTTITGSVVTSINQTQRLIDWLNAHDCKIDDVQKRTIERTLKLKTLSPEVRRVMDAARRRSRGGA